MVALARLSLVGGTDVISTGNRMNKIQGGTWRGVGGMAGWDSAIITAMKLV